MKKQNGKAAQMAESIQKKRAELSTQLQATNRAIEDKRAGVSSAVLAGDPVDPLLQELQLEEKRRDALASALAECDKLQAQAQAELKIELQKMAGEVIDKRDKKIKAIISQLRGLRADLDEVEALRQELKSQYNVNSADVFGPELTRAVDNIFTQRAHLTGNRELFGLPPKPGKYEQALSNAKESLKAAKQALKDLQARKGQPIRPGQPHYEPTAEEIERAQQRVEDAEWQLAKLEGRTGDILEAERAERQAQLEAEQQEFAVGVASWQAGWRKYAQKGGDGRGN